MIPKIIHYCWFGGAEMPVEYKVYVKEWRTLHPGWDIMLWNEVSFKDDSQYYQNSLENENWSNVSNYVRLKVLYVYGGIYLDTDVKLIKTLDDLLQYDCFLGFENGSSTSSEFWVNNAIIGACPKHPFTQKCLEAFVEDFDGTEKANESSPKLVTKVLVESYNLTNYGYQTLSDGIHLFEKDAFYPIPWNHVKATLKYQDYVTENTYAVHMWGRTWFTKEMLLAMVDDLQEWILVQEKTIFELKEQLEEYKKGVRV